MMVSRDTYAGRRDGKLTSLNAEVGLSMSLVRVLIEADVDISVSSISVSVLLVGSGVVEVCVVVVGDTDETSSRREESTVGTGCAAWIVVFKAGSKATSGMTVGSSGQMPVFRNDARMVVAVSARCRVLW